MKMSVHLFYALCAYSALAQLPPSATLPPSDLPLFHAEIDKLDALLAASPGNCWVMNEMARTWAAGQQYPETIQWLSRIADLGVGLDPARDPLYKALRGTREFEVILSRTRESIGPVSNSREAFRIAEGDLTPESEAWDPATRRFYFGSIRKGVITACDDKGQCRRFAENLGSVLGVEIARGHLWAVANQGNESALVEFEIRSGHLLHRYAVPGAGHRLNDIALSPNGDVFATDTPAGAVWKLPRGASRLESFLPGKTFRFANGIAIADDGRTLYVSNYPNGIDVVNLETGGVHPLGHSRDLCLALADGLYFHQGTLIAIQNGSMSPRVIRMTLAKNLQNVERWDVLERRNPLFQGITGGTIAGNDFYFAANIQDEKQTGAKFNPLVILKRRLFEWFCSL